MRPRVCVLEVAGGAARLRGLLPVQVIGGWVDFVANSWSAVLWCLSRGHAHSHDEMELMEASNIKRPVGGHDSEEEHHKGESKIADELA